MYLLCRTRPKIAFAIGQLSKQNVDLRVDHLKAAKKILQYLKDTMHLGITYGANKVKFSFYILTEYANNNYADDQKDFKSVIGYCFFINRAIIS